MNQQEIIEYNKRCAEFLGNKIDFNVADWSKYDDKSLTEHWNNDNKTWVHTPKGEGLPWYSVKHRGNFYQLFTDFTYQKLEKSDIELGGEYAGKYYELKDMQFHSDWNWIMEVINEILKIYRTDFYLDFDMPVSDTFTVSIGSEGKYNSRGESNVSSKEAVVQAINQFLIWYNENNNNRQSKFKNLNKNY